MDASVLAPYRQSMFVGADRLFSRCLSASAILGAVLVLAVLVAPMRPKAVAHVTTLPARMARLILDPPKAKVPDVRTLPRPASDALPPGDAGPLGDSGPDGDLGRVGAPADPAPGPAGPGPLRPSRGDATSPIGSNVGSAGRALANATVRAELAGTSEALSGALDGLTSSLASGAGSPAPSAAPSPGGRNRGMRSARSAAQVGGGAIAGLSGGAGTADLGGSAVGSRVSIGALSGGGGTLGGSGYRAGDGTGSGGGGGGGGIDGGGGYGSGTGGGGGTGSGGPGGSGRGGGAGGAGGGGGDGIGGGGGVGAPGVYRSNASLLAVIQKYAPGIHYCYTNELKHDPTLSGKLVFALIVSASGDVTDVTVVENGVRAPRLTSCALAQIREWRFPAVPRGSTSFQVPFVFTPPR